MEYDKKNFQKANDKKVLHKIRKHWVVVSTALLMALGGGAVAATHVSANADATNSNNGTNTSNVDTVKEHMNQQLQSPMQQNNNTSTQAAQQSNNSQAQTAVNNRENNSNNTQNDTNTITDQAEALHNQIMLNADHASALNGQPANDSLNQGRVRSNSAVNENEGQSNQVNLTRRPHGLLGASNYGSPDPAPQTAQHDSDGLFTVGTNGVKYNPDTQTYYTDGYSFAGAANLNSDSYDTNPSDYGALTVDYVDHSDSDLSVDTVSVSDELNGTTIDTDFYKNNLPTGGNRAPYGYELDPSDSVDSGNKIGKIVGGTRQYLVYNVKRKVQTNTQGEILVQYINQSDGRVLSYRLNTSKDGDSFQQSDYTKNIPQNFKLVNWKTIALNNDTGDVVNDNAAGTNPIGNYHDNSKQILDIYVTPSDTSTKATVDYINKNNGQIVKSRSISGNKNSDVPYDTLNGYLPQGYTLVGDASGVNHPAKFTANTPDPIIYVTPISSNSGDNSNTKPVSPTQDKSNGVAQGTINIAYVNTANNQVVETVSVTGNNGSKFSDGDTYFSNPPAGWSDAHAGSKASDLTKLSFNSAAPQTATIYVNNYQKGANFKKVNAYIQYVDYNPKTKTETNLNKITLFDYPGTPIDMSIYNQFIPAGYRFDSDGSPIYSTVQPNKTNVVYITNNDEIAAPITVKYINAQNNQPIQVSGSDDTGQIKGSYGETISDPTIASNASYHNLIPNGYTLDPTEKNQMYTINSDDQEADILVDGNKQNTSDSNDPKDTNARVLHVTRIKVDQYGNKISSDSDSYPIQGVVGSTYQVDPNNYFPAPASDYKLYGNSDTTKTFTMSDAGLNAVNPTTTFKTDGTYKNEIDVTFTYQQTNATATVNYEDQSDNNSIVGTDTIMGNPGTDMNTYYSGVNGHLKSDAPYGYQTVKTASDNPTGLVDGADYVIYVDNAQYQDRPTVQPRKGFGSLIINYGTGLSQSNGTTKGTIYNTVSVAEPNGYRLNTNDLTKYTSDGGFMPTIYTGGTPNGSDANVTPVNSDVQVLNVNVTGKHSDAKTVNDSIAYEVLTASDKSDASDTAALNNQKLTPRYIEGIDGQYINYEPYTNNVPEGYYYDGMATNSTVYSKVSDDSNGVPKTPIATIYLKKATDKYTNRFPNYYPEKEVNNSHGNTVPLDKTNPSVSGAYKPLDGQGPVTSDNAHDDPITPFNGVMPLSQDKDAEQNEQVPVGYIPAWVQDVNKKWTNGFVPSDHIPSDYMPGYVPNGLGGYIAGFVPNDPSEMPQTGASDGKDPKTGKTVYVTKYVPGKINNGNGQQIPAWVPDIKGMSIANDDEIEIQYVDYYNHNDVISDFYVHGQTGTDLNFTGNGKQYMKDIPVGYVDPAVLGEDGNTNPNGDGDGNYEFVSGQNAPIVKISVKKYDTANVIYQDALTGYQVGETPISLSDGASIDFGVNGNEHKYEQLLPYGYSNPQPQGNNLTMQNGASYVIKVTNDHVGQPMKPSAQHGYGQIIVNYVDKDTHKIISTNSFTGQDGTAISQMSGLYSSAASDGFVPYGFLAPTQSDVELDNIGKARFNHNDTPQVFSLNVAPDPNAKNKQIPNYSDLIGYQVVTKNGDKQLDYNSNHTGVTTAGSSDDSRTPVTFTVNGQAGSTINYTPYQMDVPAGYQYDGMGSNYSSVIDAGHTATSGQYDQILLRPVTKGLSLGTITVNYVDVNAPKGSKPISTMTLQGLSDTGFNLGYYEENLPSQISSDEFVGADNNPLSFTSQPQTVNIKVQQPAAPQSAYSSVHVYFVPAATTKPSDVNNAVAEAESQDATTKSKGIAALEAMKVSTSQPETMTSHVGDIFTPYAYEYNVPQNATFNKIFSGNDIDSFTQNDQYLVIGVDSTDGSF